MTAVLLAFQVTVQADERPSEQLLTQAARNELLDVDAIDCHGMDVAINEAS